jgi:putative DNA primase/helicase
MSTLINLGLSGLKRVLTNNDFTRCDAVDAEIRAIEENNNPLITFVNNHRVEHQDVGQLYSEYVWWASNNGVQSMSKPTFIKQIASQCGLVVTTVELDGKSIDIFGRK